MDLVHWLATGDEQGARGEEPPRAEWTDAGERKRREKEERDLRRLRIAEMLLAHVPYRTIGAQLGISKSMVAKEVALIRAEWRERAARAYQTHVDEELGKIEALERYVLAKAMHGGLDEGADLAAVDRAIALMDRRARLLGLDKPQKVEVAVEDLEAKRQRARELLDQVDELAARRHA